MADDRIEQLLRADAGLSRSFIAYIAGQAASLIWMLFLASPAPGGRIQPSLVSLLLVVFPVRLFHLVRGGRRRSGKGAR